MKETINLSLTLFTHKLSRPARSLSHIHTNACEALDNGKEEEKFEFL
jgi:hypothetical protein